MCELMGKLFKIYLGILVVVSIIQALAMGYLWGFEDVASQWDLINDLRVRLFPKLGDVYVDSFNKYRGIHVSILTSLILCVFWLPVYSEWMHEKTRARARNQNLSRKQAIFLFEGYGWA